jgi:hypothetical protein
VTEIAETKMTILHAIRYSIEAWADVSTETIANCWGHTRILPERNADADENANQEDEATIIQEIEEGIKALGLTEPMNVSYFLDNPLEQDVNDLPQIEEIIEYCRLGDDDSSEDEEDEEPRVVSCKEASQALETLRLFTLQSEDAEDETGLVDKFARLINQRMKMSLKQRTIDDYFKNLRSVSINIILHYSAEACVYISEDSAVFIFVQIYFLI